MSGRDPERPARRILDRLGDVDLIVLVAGFVAVLAVWGFLAVADEVIEGDTHKLDNRLLVALRTPGDLSDPIGPPWVEEVFRDLTALGSVAVLGLVTAVVVGFLLLTRTYHAMGLVVVATLGGILLSVALKEAFDRPRPDLVPHLAAARSSSFPSGHSMLSAVVYLTLGSLLERLVRSPAPRLYLLSVAVLLTFLVGVSRVYLGVHYPTDVLAGWAVGLAWAIACWLVARRLQTRGVVEQTTSG